MRRSTNKFINGGPWSINPHLQNVAVEEIFYLLLDCLMNILHATHRFISIIFTDFPALLIVVQADLELSILFHDLAEY